MFFYIKHRMKLYYVESKKLTLSENPLKYFSQKLMYTEFYTSNIGIFKRLSKYSIGGNAWISF